MAYSLSYVETAKRGRVQIFFNFQSCPITNRIKLIFKKNFVFTLVSYLGKYIPCLPFKCKVAYSIRFWSFSVFIYLPQILYNILSFVFFFFFLVIYEAFQGTPNTPRLLNVDQEILDFETFLYPNRENTLIHYHSSFSPPSFFPPPLNWD